MEVSQRITMVTSYRETEVVSIGKMSVIEDRKIPEVLILCYKQHSLYYKIKAVEFVPNL